MTKSTATRQPQTFRKERTDQSNDTRSHTRDVGMSKRVVTTATFTASNGEISGSNGDFTNFQVGDRILVDNCNLNNGFFVVTGLDGTNQAFVVVDPPPKNEGPLAGVIVRAA